MKNLNNPSGLFRKTALIALLALTLLCLNAKNSYSQTISSSTATAQQTADANRIKLVEALTRAQNEVVAGRTYIKGLEDSIKSKNAVIKEQEKRQTLSDEAISSLQSEITIQSAQLETADKTLKVSQAEAKYLKKELDKANRKLKNSRALSKYLTVGIGVFILTTILK